MTANEARRHIDDSRVVDRVVSYKPPAGDSFQSAAHQIVMHVGNHATLHRGQAVPMLRQLGAQAPATDLIFYYREQG
jgi:uncharacterized damage-inducible protein DinB